MIDYLKNKLTFLRRRRNDPRSSYESALMFEELGDCAILNRHIIAVLSEPFARRGLTGRQVQRAIKQVHGVFYERDSVSPMFRRLETLGLVKATRIYRQDPITKRFVIVWALTKYADKIRPEGCNEHWEYEPSPRKK